MRNKARSFFLATLLLVAIAFAPLVVTTYGYYKIGVSGCVLPQFEPKPAVYCSITIPPREDLTDQEASLTRLLDYGVMVLITFPLAGVPAILTGLLCVYFGVNELLKKRENDLAAGS